LNLTKRATDLLIKWKSVVAPHHKSSKVNGNSTPLESSEQIDHSENEISTATKLSENEEDDSVSDKNKNSTNESINIKEDDNTKSSADNENKNEDKMIEDKKIDDKMVEDKTSIKTDQEEK